MKPADIEELVTRKLEAQMRTLPEIDDMWSDSKHGRVVLHAETRDEVEDLDFVWQRVRNKMSDIKPHLPSGTIGPFVNDEFGLVSVADIALVSDGFSMAEMRVVARDIRDRLYELNGVRKIDLYGVHQEQVFLDFSTTRLAQFGITGEEIMDTLVRQNVVLPGGSWDSKRWSVEGFAEVAAALRDALGRPALVHLADLVELEPEAGLAVAKVEPVGEELRAEFIDHAQGLAVEHLDDHEGAALVLAQLVDLEDVGVGELGNRFGFPLDRAALRSPGWPIEYDGDPRFEAIEDTEMRYAVNTASSRGTNLPSPWATGQ